MSRIFFVNEHLPKPVYHVLDLPSPSLCTKNVWITRESKPFCLKNCSSNTNVTLIIHYCVSDPIINNQHFLESIIALPTRYTQDDPLEELANELSLTLEFHRKIPSLIENPENPSCNLSGLREVKVFLFFGGRGVTYTPNTKELKASGV